MLGVNRHTARDAIYGELGRMPLLPEILGIMFKYWHRIKNLPDTYRNKLLLGSLDIRENHLTGMICNKWLHTLKYVLSKCELEDTWNNGTVRITKFIKLLNAKLKGTFTAEWQQRINSDDKRKNGQHNKLRTYRTFKQSFVREPYLAITRPQIRRSVAQLRVSAHKLEIERGRHVPFSHRLPPEQRTCKYCTSNAMEDEIHFLITCPFYHNLRAHLFNAIIKYFPSFSNLTTEHKFIWLMSNEDEYVISVCSQFIYNAFQKRSNSEH